MTQSARYKTVLGGQGCFKAKGVQTQRLKQERQISKFKPIQLKTIFFWPAGSG